MRKRPVILITNDDGIHASGLRKLIDFCRPLGEIVVVAPQEGMSGMGHAITVKHPLRLKKIHEGEGYREYSCNGTPVDAVKLGEKVILDHQPDLLVSGINHGSNTAVNIIYSGTMAAVLEGTVDGIPSVGFSLNDFSPDADFSLCEPYVQNIILEVLEKGLPEKTCLNVNFPAVKTEEINGVKICKQGNGIWDEVFDSRLDPHRRSYYWLSGNYRSLENGKDTDEWALRNNYVSIVPVHYDLTNHSAIDYFKNGN